ncbi:MAG: DUF5723 family protein [Flavobacteriales bacterium]
MLKILFAMLLCGALQTVTAQMLPSIVLMGEDTTYTHSRVMLLLNGSGMAGTNTTDISFLKKNIFGGHISDIMLNYLAEESLMLNRAGAVATGSMEVYNFSDTLLGRPNWGLKAAISSNYHASLSYSGNLFNTVYRGNKQFAGDTTQLAPLIAQYQAWQKFSVGVFNKKTLSAISLALIAGEKYHSLSVSEAQLYTTPQGDSITLAYTGNYLRSDTLKSGWANGSALGLAIDADYNLPIAGNEGYIRLAMRDMGFAVWNNQSEEYDFDSLTTWTGVGYNDLFALETDTLSLPHLEDSIHAVLRKKSFASALPMSFHVSFCKRINHKHYYELGVSIWPTRAAIPLVRGTFNHFAGRHFVFSEGVSFGGYGTWGIYASAQWMPRGQWLIAASSHHIGGFTMGSARSMDVSFTIGRMFGKGNAR